MDDQNSLTPQEVADLLKIAKNTVYELIKRGELQSYKVGRKIRVDAEAVEALKKGRQPTPRLVVRESFSSASPRGTVPASDSLVICGQDSILDILSRYVENHPRGIRTYRSHKGSYNGLFALYHEEVQIATCHLWDGDTGEYNIPFVRRMLPGIDVTIIHLAKRMQGFYVQKGNPKNILIWKDLLREDVSFVNREKGSGTRVLLDEHFLLMGEAPEKINGYDREVTSHLAAASAVCRNKVDVALGNEKAACQAMDVDFIPLQQERYEMVIRKRDKNSYPFTTVLEILSSEAFRDEIAGLGGYDTSEMGKLVL